MIQDSDSLILPTEATKQDQEAVLAREVTDSVVAQFPHEKEQAKKEMIRTANELAERGSDWVDGRGQAIGSIPPRLYMRWQIMLPGCWQDRGFVEEFLADNPACCAPGYRPRRKVYFTVAGGGIGQTQYRKLRDKVNAFKE